MRNTKQSAANNRSLPTTVATFDHTHNFLCVTSWLIYVFVVCNSCRRVAGVLCLSVFDMSLAQTKEIDEQRKRQTIKPVTTQNKQPITQTNEKQTSKHTTRQTNMN